MRLARNLARAKDFLAVRGMGGRECSGRKEATSMTEPFDPANHRLQPSRFFEDFELGEAFYIPSRTVTEPQFLAFQAASGDNHPIHYDREYCRRHGHPELLAHGYQV